MLCSLCSNKTEDNSGSDIDVICPECADTREGDLLLEKLQADTGFAAQNKISKADERATEETKPHQGSSSQMKGIVIGLTVGVMVAVLGYFAYTTSIQSYREGIVQDVLKSRGHAAENIDIYVYNEVPSGGSEPLINIMANGTANGKQFNAEIQFMEGRPMGKNGVIVKTGTMTSSSGMFYR